ncbi:ATP-binding region ATPase domain protein [Gemmatirosa kalamazoonensis]|uniref:histidine kinase n=1 Tax=Gemmatirosa kalamazoonensis TaxID=861299 RepID=W0RM34_9BACT|nr:ATP-binding protein [Gemmatirosa kalamazoonensis]AHG91522.1 ATP-binding region ATPase domain protein [Gemmatirosa kalamazoonensis]
MPESTPTDPIDPYVPPPLLRALARRVALLAALAAVAGALVALGALRVAGGESLGTGLLAAAAAAAVLSVAGIVLTRRWGRRELSERYQRLAEQLRAEQAQRARVEKLATVGHMAAGIAHEVGNPLAAIAGYAHVLRTRGATIPGVGDVLDALERETARIDRIVRGLLDFARPRRVTPSAVDVNDVLAGARRLLNDQGVLRRIRVAEDLDRAAPTVFAERHELEQVFVNLLLNAADAMERVGRIALRTRIVPVDELRAPRGRAGDVPGEYVPHKPHRRVAEWLSGAVRAPGLVAQVVVADSGPGIAPDDVERVFDPFFTTKSASRGTGLGLAVVARIVDALGGAVWVQRAREGGAAFVIVLPLADGHAQSARRAAFAEPIEDALQLPLFVRNDSTPPATD